jgi:hypothetical protein
MLNHFHGLPDVSFSLRNHLKAPNNFFTDAGLLPRPEFKHFIF